METCICGNELAESKIPIRITPCRCDVPGPGRRQGHDMTAISHCPDHQGRLRRERGQPTWTDTERGATAKWV